MKIDWERQVSLPSLLLSLFIGKSRVKGEVRTVESRASHHVKSSENQITVVRDV